MARAKIIFTLLLSSTMAFSQPMTLRDPSFVGSLMPAAAGSGPTNVLNGIVAWWQLKDDSGTSPADSSGNGNTASFFGSPTWITSAPNGGGLTFNGSSEGLSVAASSSINQIVTNNAFSVCFWANATIGGSFEEIIRSENATPWFVVVNTSPAVAATTSSQYSQAGCSFATDGAWHFYVGTFNGSTVVMYRDSVELTSYSDSDITTTGNGLTIAYFSSGGQYFNGSLSAVRLYNRALTAGEVTNLYQYRQ
jgi:large repetitive protein